MKKSHQYFVPLRFVLIISAVLFMHANVKACDCIMYPVSHYVKTSESIIIVKVIKTYPDKDFPFMISKADLEVTKVFKGGIAVKKRFTFIWDGNCDLTFKENKEYILFGFQKGEEEYHTYHCCYSDDVATSSELIHQVEKELKRK